MSWGCCSDMIVILQLPAWESYRKDDTRHMISSAEAALLISKFESEKRLLWVSFFSGGGVHLWLKARVSVVEEELALLCQDGAISFVSLRDCNFEYHDERIYDEHISPALREELERSFEGALMVFFPSGEKLTLRMLRDS